MSKMMTMFKYSRIH